MSADYDTGPAFYTSRGWLTKYALGCGYIEQSRQDGIHTTLWMEHGCIHVRQHDFNKHERVFWDVFDRDLDAARKRFMEATYNYEEELECHTPS